MADYNLASTEISVEPQTMHKAGVVDMKGTLEAIAASWETIGKTWADLKLGWIGDSAEAADAFNDRLTAIQQRLFGVPDKGGQNVVKSGLLDQLRSGVLVAAGNYDAAENSVFTMWTEFCDALNEDAPDPDGEPESAQDGDFDPISVDYTDNPYPWHAPEDS